MTGATGRQGGEVVQALLASGHRVLALSRKLDVYAPHVEAMLTGLEPDRDLDPREVSDAVIHLASLPFGERPGRLTVGPYKDGIDPVNAAHDTLQNDMMEHSPIADLLSLD